MIQQSPYVFRKKLFNPKFLINVTCKIIKKEILNFSDVQITKILQNERYLYTFS